MTSISKLHRLTGIGVFLLAFLLYLKTMAPTVSFWDTGEFIASALGMIGMWILTACILGASLILGKKMGELFRSA